MADYVDISCLQHVVDAGSKTCLDLQYTAEQIQSIAVASIAPPDCDAGAFTISTKTVDALVLSALLGEAPATAVGSLSCTSKLYSPELLSTELMKLATEAQLADGTAVIGLKHRTINAFDFPDGAVSLKTGKLVDIVGAAFADGQAQLQHVDLSKNVTGVQAYAFRGCSSLSNVVLSPALRSIGSNAFQNCTSLASALVTLECSSVGAYAFSGCSMLSGSISASNIASYAFQNCTSLQSAVISGSQVGHGAFSGCSSLKSAVMLDGVKCIDEFAFYNCSALSNAELASDLTAIEQVAFAYDAKLSSIDFPQSLKRIGNSAFFNCTALTGMSLPSGLTALVNQAFSGCTSLSGCPDIPSAVISVSEYEFYKTAISGAVVNEGISALGFAAFAYCQQMLSLHLPATMKSIGMQTFKECTALSNVTMESIETIDSSAFEGCTGMRELVIKNKTFDEIVNMSFVVHLPYDCLINGQHR